ncbi:MAG: hypothetical protein IIC81_04590 [Chloroflexi bacterium]|nr:hypothetical protein [Chloroflexota bacterium]
MMLKRVMPWALALGLVILAACGSTAATTEPPLPTNAPGPSPTPIRVPTPEPNSWVQARLDSYFQLYNITPKGREAFSSLDIRQMIGQPAWYGSTGFQGFTGMGQANPAIVAHEFGHAYWGAFPVTGRPDLSWRLLEGQQLSTAMAQYHADLRAFMLQPPDRYELLRERFRNLPNLMEGDDPDLHHIGESDIVSFVGGDLNLVPPILRKYYDRFLAPGTLGNWENLLRWYLGLPAQDKRIADTYLVLAHIPKEAYQGLSHHPSSTVPQEIKRLIQREESQRLVDFADQFQLILDSDESLVDAGGVDRGFPFWRRYLREMVDLHKRYPDILIGLGQRGRATEIHQAFDTLARAKGLGTEERIDFLRDELESDQFLYNLLPILENRVLLELLDPQAGSLPQGVIGKGAGAFVEELRQFIGEVDRILAIGRASPEDGARALEEYLASLESQDEDKLGQDVDTLFELFADTDQESTKEIMARVKDSVIRELLEINPARTRFLLTPERLLDALDIQIDAPAEQFSQGLEELLENSSGNFAIDKPFIEEVYLRLSERGRVSKQETLKIIKEARLPMQGFLFQHTGDAIAILSSDLKLTLDLVEASEPVRVPPVRLIYQMIYVDPQFAAAVVEGLSQRGEDQIVSESLIYFAYDLDRAESNPMLKISLEGDALFLVALLERLGSPWLQGQMASALDRYQKSVSEGAVDPDFLDAYRRTLRAATDSLDDPGQRAELAEVIEQAFVAAGLEF